MSDSSLTDDGTSSVTSDSTSKSTSGSSSKSSSKSSSSSSRSDEKSSELDEDFDDGHDDDDDEESERVHSDMRDVNSDDSYTQSDEEDGSQDEEVYAQSKDEELKHFSDIYEKCRVFDLDPSKNPWTRKNTSDVSKKILKQKCKNMRKNKKMLEEKHRLEEMVALDRYKGLEEKPRKCAKWFDHRIDPDNGEKVAEDDTELAEKLDDECEDTKKKIKKTIAKNKEDFDKSLVARTKLEDALKKNDFVENRLTSYNAFVPKHAHKKQCGDGANFFVPFTLPFMDDVWKELHDGNLPTQEDAEHFKRMTFHPVDDREPRADDLKYDPHKDRRHFYCFVLRTDPNGEFSRNLRLKAVFLKSGLQETAKAKCKTNCDDETMWKKGGMTPLQEQKAKKEYINRLYDLYLENGGKPFEGEMSHDEGLENLCQVLKRAGTRSATKADILFCAAFSKIVDESVRFPSLNLPFADYQKQISQDFYAYKSLTPTLVNKCKRDKTKLLELTQQQKFVRAYMTPENPVKGLLLYHAAGTGKTVASVSVVSSFLDSTSGLDKGKEPWKVIWVTRDALKSTVKQAMFQDTGLASVRRAIESRKLTLEDAQNPAMFGKLRRTYAKGFPDKNVVTYNVFANFFGKNGTKLGREVLGYKKGKKPKDPLKRTLLVIDEAHNLFNVTDLPEKERRDLENGGRENIVKAIRNSYETSGEDSVRVLLVTATPLMQGPEDVCRLLNLLNPDKRKLLPETKDLKIKGRDYTVDFEAKTSTKQNVKISKNWKRHFQDRAKGTISFFAGDNDPGYFAIKKPYPELFDVQLSGIQFKEIANKCLKQAVKRPAPELRDAMDDSSGAEPMDLRDTFEAGPLEFLTGANGRPLSKVDPRFLPHKDRFSLQLEKTFDLNVKKALKALKHEGKKKKKDKSFDMKKKIDQMVTCIRNRSNMPVMKGHLEPSEKEFRKYAEKSAEKRDDAYMRERAKYHTMVEQLQKKHEEEKARWAAWDRYENLMTDSRGKIARSYGSILASMNKKLDKLVKPRKGKKAGHWRSGEYEQKLEEYTREKNRIKAVYDEKLRKCKQRRALRPKGKRPEGERPGEFKPPPFVFKRLKKPSLDDLSKDRPKFNFTFDSKDFTPKLLKRALEEYAPKLKVLMETIEELDKKTLREEGRRYKHAIYTDTQGGGWGAKILASIFMAYGYARACEFEEKDNVWTLKKPTLKSRCVGQKKTGVNKKTLEQKKTFCLLSTTQVAGTDSQDKKTLSKQQKTATKNLFNARQNMYGHDVRFIILDSGFKEGVDLVDVKFMHLVEPPMLLSSLTQAIARAVRRCKSTHIKTYDEAPKGWIVEVLLYSSMLTPPGTDLKDRKSIHSLALQLKEDVLKNQKLIDKMDDLVKETAVDADLNKPVLDYRPDNKPGEALYVGRDRDGRKIRGETAVEKYKKLLGL